jgi:hypothetical protein
MQLQACNACNTLDYAKENVTILRMTACSNSSLSRFNFIVILTTTVDGFIAHEAQAVVPSLSLAKG